MSIDLKEQWHAAFDRCSGFVRDTTLPPGFLEKYRVGLLLREPTFCDASHKIGGFVAPHRFLIISAHAKCLDDVAPQPWGLCLWQRGVFLKVIDKILRPERAQITLLEIPGPLVKLFARDELSDLECSFAQQARETFERCVTADPIPELNSDEWRRRLIYPIGIDAQGTPFPLGEEFELQNSDGMNIEIGGLPPIEADDEITLVDDMRLGDIVYFERVAPKKFAMRVLTPEVASNFVGKKFRVSEGGQPRQIELVEITD